MALQCYAFTVTQLQGSGAPYLDMLWYQGCRRVARLFQGLNKLQLQGSAQKIEREFEQNLFVKWVVETTTNRPNFKQFFCQWLFSVQLPVAIATTTDTVPFNRDCDQTNIQKGLLFYLKMR